MIQKINGRLVFTYGGPGKTSNKLTKSNLKISLLGVLIGIFLLPNIAYLSSITPERLIELTNQEREVKGLNPLSVNPLLTQAATLKAKAIIKANTFAHTINDRKFSAWVRDTGYNYSYVGENLAIDFVTSEGVVEAWNNSPLHKKNLLNPYYQEIGISTVTDKFQGQDTTLVVQIFGAPAIGSITPSTVNSGSEFLNSNLIKGDINLFNQQSINTENLLTHAIINQGALPLYNNKLALSSDNYQANQANTFVVQPGYRLTINNFLIIFLSIAAAYLLIFLYSYYFIKINKFNSAQL